LCAPPRWVWGGIRYLCVSLCDFLPGRIHALVCVVFDLADDLGGAAAGGSTLERYEGGSKVVKTAQR